MNEYSFRLQHFQIEVENYKNERGTSILNNTFALHSASPLVSKKPNWLVEKNPAEYNFREKEFLPTIHDVEPPYILIKKPQSYQFIVIKNSDTRVFRLEEY